MNDTPAPFWTDQTQADRYGEYLRLEDRQVHEAIHNLAGGLDWTRLAVEAWRVATGPVMAPPYVHHHPVIRSARLARSGWDGSLLAHVAIAAGWPAELRTNSRWHPAGVWPMTWQDGGGEPDEEDLAARPALLTQVELIVPVPLDVRDLTPHRAAVDGGEVAEAARSCVAAVVHLLNGLTAPLLGTLRLP